MSATSAWLTVAQAAELVSLSEDSIYEACLRNDLRHTKVGGRRLIRIKREWLDEWLDRHAREVQPFTTRSSIAKVILDLTKENGR